jgi:hypothetical protein
MIALWFLVEVLVKEKPPSSDALRRTEGGRVVLCLAVKNTSPFFMQVGMYVGSTYALQYFLEPVVNFPYTQTNRVTHGRSTNNSLDDCSLFLATRTGLLSR